MHFTNILTWVFPVVFVAMLFFVSHKLAGKGWTRWHRNYAASDEPAGQKMMMVSGQFAGGNYSACLNVWLSPEGIYVRPMLLFRAFHPALLIPWSRVSDVYEVKVGLSKVVRVDFDLDDPAFALMLRAGMISTLQSYAPNLPVDTDDDSGAA